MKGLSLLQVTLHNYVLSRTLFKYEHNINSKKCLVYANKLLLKAKNCAECVYI